MKLGACAARSWRWISPWQGPCWVALVLALPLLAVATARAEEAEVPAKSEPSLSQKAKKVTLHLRTKGSGKPIRRAEITIGGEKKYTDKQGNITVELAPNTGTIEIYRTGYETLTLNAKDLPVGSALDVFLTQATPKDDEIVVQGEKPHEASRKVISVEEAAKVSPNGDPAQVAKLLPGVQSNSLTPDIVVRGSSPNDTIYLVDDFSVPFVFHQLFGVSVMPDLLMSDVEFSGGGFGAQYGNATGGVVKLITRNTVSDQPHTEFRVNIPFYSSIYHETPVNDGKDMVALSLRRSYLNYLLPPLLKGQGGAGETLVPIFGDEHVYYLHPTDDGFVKVIAMHAYDQLTLLAPSSASITPQGQANFDSNQSFELLGVEVRKQLDANWLLNVTPSLYNTDAFQDSLNNNTDSSVRGVNLHTDLVRRLEGKDRLYLGAEVGYGLAQVNFQTPPPASKDPFYNPSDVPADSQIDTIPLVTVSAWTAMDAYIGKNLLLTPGVRAFYNKSISKANLDPRLNWRYQLDQANTLKGALGQYSEAPQFVDSDKTFGNPNLKFIRSYQYILGIETNWSDLWTTDFQGFYKEVKDQVTTETNNSKNNNGSQISAGFEVFIRRNLTERLFGWTSYTYSQNRSREEPNENYHNSPYDQVHILNIVGNYKLTAVWELGGRFNYHTGDTYTAVDHSVYNIQQDGYEPRQAPGEQLYGKHLPDYHEVDIYASRDVLYNTWKLTWRFGIEYLWTKPQAEIIGYNYDYSKTSYYTGLPPIPYVELRGVL